MTERKKETGQIQDPAAASGRVKKEVEPWDKYICCWARLRQTFPQSQWQHQIFFFFFFFLVGGIKGAKCDSEGGKIKQKNAENGWFWTLFSSDGGGGTRAEPPTGEGESSMPPPPWCRQCCPPYAFKKMSKTMKLPIDAQTLTLSLSYSLATVYYFRRVLCWCTTMLKTRKSINQSINQLINQSINQSVSQSVSKSVNKSINQSINQ